MLDLKYCMQYLMMKALSQRNRKAALKALDQHISDCDAYVVFSLTINNSTNIRNQVQACPLDLRL